MTRQKAFTSAVGMGASTIYLVLVYFVMSGSDALPTASFFFLVPAALTLLPLLFFKDDDQVALFSALLLYPCVGVFGFSALALALHVEALLCLVALIAPFAIVILLVAWVVKALRVYNAKRARDVAKISLLLPFFFAPIERQYLAQTESHELVQTVSIRASDASVWNQIVDVAPIAPAEYPTSLFHQLNVPRPLWASVDRHATGGMRIGIFDSGMRLQEPILSYQKNRLLLLAPQVDPHSVDPQSLVGHALLGDYFAFTRVWYKLRPVADDHVELSLGAAYELRTTVNWYGKLWADLILKDFEQNLLQVIRNRSERAIPTTHGESTVAALH